jgi:hypothetical protein
MSPLPSHEMTATLTTETNACSCCGLPPVVENIENEDEVGNIDRWTLIHCTNRLHGFVAADTADAATRIWNEGQSCPHGD